MQTVVGIFNSASEAQNAVHQLLSNGFDASNVDYASGRNAGTHANPTGTDNEYVSRDTDHDAESGITRFFKNLFGDDDDDNANRYSRVADKGCIVTVHAQSADEAERASDLLDRYGAVDVDEKDREYSQAYDSSHNNRGTVSKTGDYTGTNTTTNPGFDDTNADDVSEGTRKIPVIEENLEVGKKVVEKGGVRLRSRIIHKPVEQTVRLREEHITVERNKVDRPVNDNDFDNFKEGTTDVRERAEVPEVSKTARVVEEVSLDKTIDHHDETIRDNVRKTQVDIEDINDDDRIRNRNTNTNL